MRYFEELTNLICFKRLENDLRGNSLSHCYLLVGMDKEAKTLIISYFLSAVFCEHRTAEGLPCLTCLGCRKALAKTHDRVNYYPSDEGAKLTPDSIKELLNALAYSSEQRFFVLNDIDEASAIAQNKLLKTLEEPPKNTVILLTATNTSKVLNTILSRAKILTVDPIPATILGEALIRHCYNDFRTLTNERKANRAAVYSQGNITVAERMLVDEQYERIYDSVFHVLRNYKTSKDMLRASEYLMEFKANPETVIDFFAFAARDFIMHLSGNSELILAKDNLSSIEEIARDYNIQILADILLKLNEMKKRLSVFCAVQGIFDNLLILFMEGRAKCLR